MPANAYPAHVTEIAPGDFELRFRDVPEAITGGPSLESAWAAGSDALEAALEGYVALGRAPPRSSLPEDGERLVHLAPECAARLELAEAMRRHGLTKVALAARMKKDEKVVRRILSGKGASLELTLDALRAAETPLSLQPCNPVDIWGALIDIELKIHNLRDNLVEGAALEVSQRDRNALNAALKAAGEELRTIRHRI